MRILLLILFILMVFSSTFPQWTRTNGPEGISISCLVTIDSIIYAGTQVDGLYASTDDGLNWIPLNAGIETLEVTAVVNKPGYLFAGTFGGGAYRSSDGGQTWMAPQTGGNLAVTAIVVQDPYIFLGTVDQGVYRSADNGVTWIQKLGGFTGIQAMCVSGNTLFASTYGYTYGSDDGGETWFDVAALQGAGIFSLYCRDSLMIAGAVNQIYKSVDYGNTFTPIPITFSFGLVNIYDITELDSTLFIATSYDGVYKSTDMGLNWSASNTGMGPKDARALTVSSSSTLIAGTQYVGVYRSTDLGSSWNKSMTGFPAGSSILTILVNGTSVFAGTRDGVYRTDDNGDNWVKLAGVNDTTRYGNVWAMCELDDLLYASTQIRFNVVVYKSNDNGDTWIRCGNAGLPAGLSFMKSLVSSGGNIVAGTDEGIYYSSDGGANWSATNVSNLNVPSLAASSNYVYAAVPSGAGIYRSSNSGVSWMVSLQSTVDYVEVAAIDNFAFAGSFFAGARYSSNYGGTWFASGGFPPDASIFALGPVDNGMILAGTDLGPTWVYASFNSGVSYSPYSEGLGQRAPVEAFAVNDSFLFAGTDYNGVWRRLRPGLVGITEYPNIANGFYLEQNYPNPFNPTTVISWQLAVGGPVKLTVYNLAGQKISVLVDEKQSAGHHSIEWNANVLPSGVYFYRLDVGGFTSTKKMILLQ